MSSFRYQVTHSAASSNLSTVSLFDTSYSEVSKSPIDRFNEHLSEVNKLFVTPSQITRYSSHMLVLSYVSLVESYLREVLRKIIALDETAQKACENITITYGAALVSGPNILPEAILESYSFANGDNILSAFKTTLGIKGKHTSTSLKKVLGDFDCVCQVRHCLVHRFGFLGTNNIIKLGLKEHKELVAKPFSASYADTQTIALVCSNTVKECNQYLFEAVLSNTANDRTIDWKWNFIKDKKHFKSYYEIFHSTDYNPDFDKIMKNCYDEFRKYFK